MDNATPLDEYLKEKIDQIKKSLPEGVNIHNPVIFEFHTVSTKEAGGGLKFWVLNVGAKVSDKEVHKTTISLDFKSELDVAEEDAQKTMLNRIKKDFTR